MQLFIGTSGWRYSWNLGGSLSWYIENSGLNAVELNASFYRFPFPSQIKGWAKSGKALRWAIKVTRRITHLQKFSDESYEIWNSFKELFSPMDELIDFFLFQLPPSMKYDMFTKIQKFIEYTNLKERLAVELRNIEWFNNDIIKWAKETGITLVSVDAPKLPRTIYNTNGIVYLRMHGRTAWYSYEYSREELKEIVNNVLSVSPERVYIFFNNDHAMLRNAQEIKEIFAKRV